MAFGSEKNFYIDADIGKIWNTYESLVDKAKLDERGRAVVNVRWIVGGGGVDSNDDIAQNNHVKAGQNRQQHCDALHGR